MPDQQAAHVDRLHVVDALRGCAALAVVLYHSRNQFWVGLADTWRENGVGGGVDTWLGYLSAPLSYGWLGVQLFFVLSGYCIHRRFAALLAANHHAATDWQAFYLRRFLRIYPVYIAALLLTAAIDNLRAFSGEVLPVDTSLPTFLANVLTLQGIAAPTFGTNTVFWTLSIEIHLYLFYPLLHRVNASSGPSAMLLFAFAVSFTYILADYFLDLSMWFPYAHGTAPVFLPFVFMWACGAFVADIHAGRAKAPQGALWHAAWLVSLLLGLFAPPLPGCILLAVGMSGSVYFLLRGVERHSALHRFLIMPLALLGLCSYSLYAVHRPVFGLIEFAGIKGQFDSIVIAGAAGVAAVAAAWLLYVSVEQPSLAWAAKWRR